MTHQEHIAKVIAAILQLPKETREAFSRSNPFSMLLRSYDEHNSVGDGLYQHKRGKAHYRYSVAALESGLPAEELYGEHRIPLKVIRQRLMDCDSSYESVLKILRENEVVLLTRKEGRHLDGSEKNGGCGLRDRMAPGGGCRFAYAKILIAESTLGNGLHVPPAAISVANEATDAHAAATAVSNPRSSRRKRANVGPGCL